MDLTWFGTPRARHACALSSMLLLALGCDDSDRDSQRSRAETPSAAETSAGQAAANGSGAPKEIDAPPIHVAANDPSTRAPMDATPSPDGSRVYYTALQAGTAGDDVPGVFATGNSGGAIETIAAGGMLESPSGISISLDGKMLFVADTASGDQGNGGAILTLPASGGNAVALAGTEGYAPTGLVVARVDDEERLYFTGHEPSGEPGLFRVGAAGGAVQKVASSASFVDPGAVAVDDTGTAYVVDAQGGVDTASLLRVRDGKAETMLANIGVGFPSGVALDKSGAKVFVSGIDPTRGEDVVYVVDAASGEVAVLSKPFAGFREAAGLHRAHERDLFAWADSEAGDGTGTVFTLGSM